MFSHFFIDRPIFATVIAIAGAVAMFNLPFAQYPDITPVQIQVTATYPGADAHTVARNVGAPIEQQVNGADRMIYMQSTSSSTGNYTLNVYFEQGTDPQLAQVDVQNRVQWAMPQLPEAVGSRAADLMMNHPAVANVTQVDGYSLIDIQRCGATLSGVF